MHMELPTVPSCEICSANTAQLWGVKNNYAFYQCRTCDFVFVHPHPTLPPPLYNEDYFSGATQGFGYTNYDQDKIPMRSTFNRYLDYLEMYTPARGMLLDVGAATGFFLDLARARNWRTQGIEISEYAAAQAREKGLSVTTGTIENPALAENFFDVLTMWDVIEHVPDPKATLARAAKLLKPGGLLAINTPHGGSLMARLLKTHCHQWVPPEHLYFFSPKNFARLLEPLG